MGASLLAVLVGSAVVWLLLGSPQTGVDDADISLVYARHLIDGHGFAYNIGGERIEGFTSMLWMLCGSFLFTFFDRIEFPLFLMNVAFGTATVYACLRRSDRRTTFLILLCAAPAWFAWCQVAMMESGLWCMLLTLTILAVSERRITPCVWLLPLLVLTRPEALLWGAWLIVVLFLCISSERGGKAGLRAVFPAVFIFGTFSSSLLLFRGYYFGYPFPNPYYAKVSHDVLSNMASGISYLFGYLFSSLPVFVVIVAFSFVVIRECYKRRWLSRPLAVGLCLLPGVAIPVLAGGDHLDSYRFYQPIWPLLCLLASWGLPLLYSRIPNIYRRIVPVALVLTGWTAFIFTEDLQKEFITSHEGREHGKQLQSMFNDCETLPSIAVVTPGGYKYAYHGKVFDLMGLNSIEMAQAIQKEDRKMQGASINRDVFYRWHPDILVQGDPERFNQYVMELLEGDPLFHLQYMKGELWFNDGRFAAYYSKRFLSSLPEGFYAFVPDLRDEPLFLETPEENPDHS